MEKKVYETPEIEVFELDKQPNLLDTSNAGPKYYDEGEFN